MLTEEQIKNLKNGDTVIYQGKFIGITDMNEIAICDTQSKPYICFARDRIGLSIPLDKPKYDPTRRFKKGDKVRLHHVHGRPATHSGDMLALPWKNDKNEDVIYEVVLDEEESEEGNGILLTSKYLNQYVVVHVSHLELVTPVEERIPYAIDPANTNRILQYGQKFAEFEDDDAARACCNMLNDEWRKKHQNEGARLNAENRKELE